MRWSRVSPVRSVLQSLSLVGPVRPLIRRGPRGSRWRGGISKQGFEQSIDRQIVGCIVALVRQENRAPPIHDESAAQLPQARALGRESLQMAFNETQGSLRYDLGAENVKGRAFAELHGFVRLAFLIDQQREWDLALLLEVRRHLGETLPDRDNLGPRLSEVLIPVAQLRDVLAAESSAVMAEPNEDDRLVSPEVGQCVVLSVRVG